MIIFVFLSRVVTASELSPQCRTSLSAIGGDAPISETESVQLTRQSRSIEGAPYDSIEPSPTSELGQLATLYQSMGLTLGQSKDFNLKTGRQDGAFVEPRTTVMLSAEGITSGRPSETDLGLLSLIQKAYGERIQRDQQTLNEFGVAFSSVQTPNGEAQKITPDPNTVLGRKALQLQSMGIELLVNTFHLDAKRAMGVLLPNEGVLMLKAKVLDANHGGFVLNHEMDHAILSQMEKNGEDSLFHGHLQPKLSQGFPELPPLYARGFGLDEPRGQFRVAVDLSRELLKKSLSASEKAELVREIRSIVSEGTLLGKRVIQAAERTRRGLQGETWVPGLPQEATGGGWIARVLNRLTETGRSAPSENLIGRFSREKRGETDNVVSDLGEFGTLTIPPLGQFQQMGEGAWVERGFRNETNAETLAPVVSRFMAIARVNERMIQASSQLVQVLNQENPSQSILERALADFEAAIPDLGTTAP